MNRVLPTGQEGDAQRQNHRSATSESGWRAVVAGKDGRWRVKLDTMKANGAIDRHVTPRAGVNLHPNRRQPDLSGTAVAMWICN
ncbi:MAG: hypothetical protein QGG42_09425 [Phycisphaerae bacterium]|jgi:hypothetical protein|nr:hypothetical protein [Phycisphaerae bacterium]